MSGPNLPETPVPLKSIQPFLKIATEHEQRDMVVSYWCRLYALQTGLKCSTKTTEETNFLLKLMDWLETTKKSQHDNEAITNDVAAQAHLENWALKLFLYADKNDRAANFGKNVIQSFYTAGLLYDVLTTFGELSEEATQNRKYAKWKAAYIHNCLKNGETPVPGPAQDEEDDNSNENIGSNIDNEENEDFDDNNADFGAASIPPQPMQPLMPYPMLPMQPTLPTLPSQPPASTGPYDFPSVPVTENEDDKSDNNIDEPVENNNDKADENVTENEENEENKNDENEEEPAPNDEGEKVDDNINETDAEEQPEDKDDNNEPEPNAYNPAPTPTNPGMNNSASFDSKPATISSESGVQLSIEQSGKAQKYIKWAGSALNYDDVPTAIMNLKKALHLLTTGQDPA